jgi:hypothetical protein
MTHLGRRFRVKRRLFRNIRSWLHKTDVAAVFSNVRSSGQSGLRGPTLKSELTLEFH